MLDVNKITINAAFYELFESTFGEDFFNVINELRSTPEITRLREKNENDLSDEEREKLETANLDTAKVMKKYTSRIAYIGTKLYNKQYNCSYDDFIKFLSTCGSSDFLDPDFITALWDKITKDQSIPSSVKNV